MRENPSYALDKSIKATGWGAAGPEVAAGAAKSTELLRSQDRVVSLLYHRAFPVDGALPVPSAAGGSGGGGGAALPAEALARGGLTGVDVSTEELRAAMGERYREGDLALAVTSIASPDGGDDHDSPRAP